MSKEELIVELENNYIQINIDGVRISYCNTLDKELVKAIYELQQENKKLKEQLDKYENPDDMTLMMMWATDKVKDENKQLKYNWNRLKETFEKEGFEIYTREYGSLDVISKDFIFDTIIELEKGEEND